MTADTLRLVHAYGEHLSVRLGDIELARYVYRPDHPRLESPKPYFHPLRTIDGDVVTAYRPWDHIWHKGLQVALPHVGDENFWGGPTYVRGRGYTQLENNGSQDHVSYDEVRHGPDDVGVLERLDWHTQSGARWLTERREWLVRLASDEGHWSLGIRTSLTNERATPVAFGSPTTNGRPAAGYGGLFWRGPRSFTGCRVLTPAYDGAEAAMGARDRWLAYVGRYDGSLREASMVFVDRTDNPRHPTPWFVRSEPYAAVCPAPFFDEELELAAGATLTFGYDVVVGGGAWDRDRVERVVAGLPSAGGRDS